jgi:hypothetical protein
MTRTAPAQLRRQHYLSETGRTEKAPLLPRHLPRRKTARELRQQKQKQQPRTAAEIAEGDGFRLGSADIHTSPANYRTGEEWLAWFRGWKRGQQPYKKALWERMKDL